MLVNNCVYNPECENIWSDNCNENCEHDNNNIDITNINCKPYSNNMCREGDELCPNKYDKILDNEFYSDLPGGNTLSPFLTHISQNNLLKMANMSNLLEKVYETDETLCNSVFGIDSSIVNCMITSWGFENSLVQLMIHL